MSLTTSRTSIDENESQAVATEFDGRRLGSASDVVDSDPLDVLCQSVETGTSQPSTRAAFGSAGREVCVTEDRFGKGSENVV